MLDLSTVEARLALAKKYATKYLLDSALICAVAEHESSWNPWACRYEPYFLTRYVRPKTPVPTTAELTRAMSFGLMQVMGEVAIELGYSGRFLTALCDPDIGMDYGCKKLRKCCETHPQVENALLAYNGGSDPSYPKIVMDLMSKYYV